MHYDEVEFDSRVIVHTHQGDVHGTALAKTPADEGRSSDSVLVAYDNGASCEHLADALSPLDPAEDFRDPDTLPRLWRRDWGWLFWRGGRRWWAYKLVDAWRVIEWKDDEDAEGELLVLDKGTRAEAIDAAIEIIDTRRAMTFHREVMPSIKGGASNDHLTGDGWEVWPVSEFRHEVAYCGDLTGALDLTAEGWSVTQYDVDEVAYELWQGVASIEAAAALVRSLLPFAE